MNSKNVMITFILLFVLSGCLKSSDQMPDDFNFSLDYGTYGKQKIDTFNGVIVKDLVEDGTIEAEISFTKHEMEDIYQWMIDMNIMGDLDLREDLLEGESCGAEPLVQHKWNIQMNGQDKLIQFDGDYCETPDDVLKLLKLADEIHDILASKEEYKQFPEPNGYYE